MTQFIRSSWKKTDKKALDPKLSQQVFSTSNIMVVRYVYQPGLHFPEHSHPQEQVTIVQEGRLEFKIHDKIVELNGTVECYQFLDSVDVHEKGETKDDFSSFFIPPYLSEWLFVFIRDEVITVNITITDEILKI